jgi:hypothetical protein
MLKYSQRCLLIAIASWTGFVVVVVDAFVPRSKTRGSRQPQQHALLLFKESDQIPDYSPYANTRGYNDMLEVKGKLLSNMFGLSSTRRTSPTNEAEENEDGWSEMRKVEIPTWKKILRLPLKLSKKALFPEPPIEPGTLILVRHGESTWNANRTFTGWCDYPE